MSPVYKNPIIVALLFLMIGAGAGYFTAIYSQTHPNHPGSVACTQEAKLCSDGSYVGREGLNCEFAPCPGEQQKSECAKDADCPSSDYVCEGIQGVGTVSPGTNGDSTFQITNGVCKKKEGKQCSADNDCESGLLCNQDKCTKPVGQSCGGVSDKGCPSGYTCIQDCGPPILPSDREYDVTYHCVLNEHAKKPRMCPICLASNTMIATPSGEINVHDIKPGIKVWSVDESGRKIASHVLKISRTPVPTAHRVVHLALSDNREVWASLGHPTSDGRTMGDLRAGENYDNARINAAEIVPYWDDATYDILPDSATGYYWANGIILGSTLK